MTILEKLQKADRKTIKNTLYGRPRTYITKAGNLNQQIKDSLRACRIEGNKIYPFDWTGSGNYISAVDRSTTVEVLLKDLGYKFSKGNDAPRGGKSGNYIKVSKKALEAFNQVTKL